MGRPSRRDDEPTTHRALQRPVSVGDVIGDKYRLADTLGSGGMGRVYAAHHLMLDTKVALKFMHPHLLRDPVAVARFAREARAAATLKSAHAARIIDVDELPSGELYIVMEYLEGQSLETVAASRRGLLVTDAVRHVLQACDALAEAHARGIVHRDVKPANLFLTAGGSAPAMVKVLDFGLAKSMGPRAFVAPSAEVFGTPQYMSPEQIRGAREVDARTDVWSIGVTLYELLAGRTAFDGQGAANIFVRILTRTFTPLRTLRPDVPPALAAVIDRCMAHEPAERFATIDELARALAASAAPAAPARYFATLPSAGAAPSAPELPSERDVTFRQRPAWSSYSAAALTLSHDESRPLEAEGPSVGQTVLAALAGPALIAVVAACVVLFVGTARLPALGMANTAPRPAAVVAARAVPDVLGAKAVDLPARAKAIMRSPEDARPSRPRARQAATRR